MLLEWWERYRRFFLGAGAIVFIGSSLWLYQASTPTQTGSNSQLPLITPAYASAGSALDLADESSHEMQKQPTPPKNKDPRAKVQEKDETAPLLFVDVKGRVKKPGLYELDAGMRVADAIAKAGGASADADLEQINLAAPLTDGTAIVILAKGSLPAPDSAPALPSSYKPGSAPQTSAGTEESININTATADQLMSLPGIGEARAHAILRYREEKGSFRSPDELKEIEGIGDKLYERIQDRLRIQ